jgi:CDP-diacylglycerol--glycerol-3-phosphate 3-phosphatidyltransferase
MTTFGKFADPIADRLLYTVMFLLFVNDGLISLVPVFNMIARDAVEDGCRIVASANEKEVHAGTMGKLKNILQRITIVLILLNNLPFELWGLPVSGVLLWFTAFVSFVSGVQYFNQMKEDILESR